MNAYHPFLPNFNNRSIYVARHELSWNQVLNNHYTDKDYKNFVKYLDKNGINHIDLSGKTIYDQKLSAVPISYLKVLFQYGLQIKYVSNGETKYIHPNIPDLINYLSKRNFFVFLLECDSQGIYCRLRYEDVKQYNNIILFDDFNMLNNIRLFDYIRLFITIHCRKSKFTTKNKQATEYKRFNEHMKNHENRHFTLFEQLWIKLNQ